jgi:general secretion pathway protein J
LPGRFLNQVTQLRLRAQREGGRHRNYLPSTRRACGFTLIEVLLALAIFGVLCVLAYRATAAMTDSEARLTAEASRWRALEALFVRFEADARAAVPRASRTGSGVEPAWLATIDRAGQATVILTRAGAEFGTDSGMPGQRIGYRLADGAIEIAYWPHLDNPANTRPTIYRLAEGVVAWRIEYLTETGAWRDTWPLLGDAPVPRALRVGLTLAGGESIERWFALR